MPSDKTFQDLAAITQRTQDELDLHHPGAITGTNVSMGFIIALTDMVNKGILTKEEKNHIVKEAALYTRKLSGIAEQRH